MSSADNLYKQFGTRSESKLFDTLMVFLKEFFRKYDFEKKQQTTTMHTKLPSRQRVEKIILCELALCPLGNSSCFFGRNQTFQKIISGVRVSSSLDPDQARCFVRPYLLPNISKDISRRHWEVKS